MKNNEMTPKIRFKGFSDPWEQRKFSTLYKKVIKKNDGQYNYSSVISVANMYFKDIYNSSYDEYLKTYNIFKYGDIAFEGNKSKNFSMGRFVENDIGNGIVSHVFDVFRPINDYDIYYWKYYINNETIMRNVLRMCTSKSTMMTNLVSKDFLKQSILVPDIKEQNKIGELLQSIDQLITANERSHFFE